MTPGQRCEQTCDPSYQNIGFYTCLRGNLLGNSLCIHDGSKEGLTIHYVEKMSATIALDVSKGVAFDTDTLRDSLALAFEVAPEEFTEFSWSWSNSSANGTNRRLHETDASADRRLQASSAVQKPSIIIKYQLVVPENRSASNMLQKAYELTSNGPAFDRMFALLANRSKAKGNNEPFTLGVEQITPNVIFTDVVLRFADGKLVAVAPPPPVVLIHKTESDNDWWPFLLIGAFICILGLVVSVLLVKYRFRLLTLLRKPEEIIEPSEPPISLDLDQVVVDIDPGFSDPVPEQPNRSADYACEASETGSQGARHDAGQDYCLEVRQDGLWDFVFTGPVPGGQALLPALQEEALAEARQPACRTLCLPEYTQQYYQEERFFQEEEESPDGRARAAAAEAAANDVSCRVNIDEDGRQTVYI